MIPFTRVEEGPDVYVVTYDRMGNRTYVDERLTMIFGLAIKRAVGSSMQEHGTADVIRDIHGRDVPLTETPVAVTLRTGAPVFDWVLDVEVRGRAFRLKGSTIPTAEGARATFRVTERLLSPQR